MDFAEPGVFELSASSKDCNYQMLIINMYSSLHETLRINYSLNHTSDKSMDENSTAEEESVFTFVGQAKS